MHPQVNVNFWPRPEAMYYITDPAPPSSTEAAPLTSQEIIDASARILKPLEMYELLAAFGSNILVTEGGEWNR